MIALLEENEYQRGKFESIFQHKANEAKAKVLPANKIFGPNKSRKFPRNKSAREAGRRAGC